MRARFLHNVYLHAPLLASAHGVSGTSGWCGNRSTAAEMCCDLTIRDWVQAVMVAWAQAVVPTMNELDAVSLPPQGAGPPSAPFMAAREGHRFAVSNVLSSISDPFVELQSVVKNI